MPAYAKAPGRASALDGCTDTPDLRLGTLFVSLRVGAPKLAAELHEVLVNSAFGTTGVDTYGDPLADGFVNYEFPVESAKLPFERWELWFPFSPELSYGITMRGTPATPRRPNDPPPSRRDLEDASEAVTGEQMAETVEALKRFIERKGVEPVVLIDEPHFDPFHDLPWSPKPPTDDDDELKTDPKSDPKADAWDTTKPWTDDEPIEPRSWLNGKHNIRGSIGGTVAPGGMGKTSLLIVEALALATGRQLLHFKPKKPCRVLLWNGEDSPKEMRRRVAAAKRYFQITDAEIGGRLFVLAGAEYALTLMTDARDVATPNYDAVNKLRRFIRKHKIDFVVIDPFIRAHQVPESDNNKMSEVCRVLSMIAVEWNCAIELVHHMRKTGRDQKEHTAEDWRGASAVVAACRSVRLLIPMTSAEAEAADIDEGQRGRYFRTVNGKANMAPPAANSDWHCIASHDMDNANADDDADNVGVVERFDYPQASMPFPTASEIAEIQRRIKGGHWRHDAQAKLWAGRVIADVLAIDHNANKATLKTCLDTLIVLGALEEYQGQDSKRMPRRFVKEGDAWARGLDLPHLARWGAKSPHA